jgi:hypothetical protein
MADGSYIREYRLGNLPTLLPIVLPAGAFIVLAAWFAATDDGNNFVARIVFPPVAIGAWLFFIVWAQPRSGTLVSADGIATRGVIRRTWTAWPDVQGIEVRRHSSGVSVGVIYDRNGRALKLNHLNTRRVAAVKEEVRALRKVWLMREEMTGGSSPEVADGLELK